MCMCRLGCEFTTIRSIMRNKWIRIIVRLKVRIKLRSYMKIKLTKRTNRIKKIRNKEKDTMSWQT